MDQSTRARAYEIARDDRRGTISKVYALSNWLKLPPSTIDEVLGFRPGHARAIIVRGWAYYSERGE